MPPMIALSRDAFAAASTPAMLSHMTVGTCGCNSCLQRMVLPWQFGRVLETKTDKIVAETRGSVSQLEFNAQSVHDGDRRTDGPSKQRVISSRPVFPHAWRSLHPCIFLGHTNVNLHSSLQALAGDRLCVIKAVVDPRSQIMAPPVKRARREVYGFFLFFFKVLTQHAPRRKTSC